MSEMTHGASMSAGIDLSQFFQVFFEEAGENLEQMERMLLAINVEAADDEELNAIFRCAHSVKGGAATFGFTDVAELTHQMETLLDKLRRHELTITPEMVDVLLQAGDALKAQLARHQGNGADPIDTTELLFSIRAGRRRSVAAAPPAAAQPAAAAAAPAAAPAPRRSRGGGAVGRPRADPDRGSAGRPVAQAEQPVRAVQGDPRPGHHRPHRRRPGGRRHPPLPRPHVEHRRRPAGPVHLPRGARALRIDPATAGYGFFPGSPGAPAEQASPGRRPRLRFLRQRPGSPAAPERAGTSASARRPGGRRTGRARTCRPHRAPPCRNAGAAAESSTLRVSVEKVDQLINLVGELVITQAMLAQNGKNVDSALHQQLASGLADLERNTRDLQEAVMSIRMIPMSLVFNRFPRMLRDLAGKLGKKVELVTQGEATELDKGLVEKITDPLTHLVRNSCDHGIELPADRLAKGKPEVGTITLVASHQGGSIVIEVRDDGRGLNRDKLIAKARERGIDVHDSMSDQDAYGLIFAPGFSTADVVTDVSGRGVGMDVVKKNITSLGGTVEIDSAEGYGMTVRVRLPLTLAIMDGMSVGVGEECYILPLSSVVESFQVEQGMVKTIGGSGRVVEVRDEYMPVIDLERVFDVPRFDFERVSNIMVVVEAEGRPRGPAGRRAARPAAGGGEEPRSQLPPRRRRVGRHHPG
jgi:two-component system chemotaxis sensor kinase CheA